MKPITGVLSEIVEKTKARIQEFRKAIPFKEVSDQALDSRKPQDFMKKLSEKEISVIAEVKFASPSEGVINSALNHLEVASGYLDAGAAALSVLTEPYYFKGDLQYLSDIRKEFPEAALLMKEFVIDEYQIAQARAYGADAVLLLASVLTVPELARMIKKAQFYGLTPLVEVHDEAELQEAVQAKACLIGVNNRDLKTLKVSLEVSHRLASLAPHGTQLISESGIQTREQMEELRGIGYRAFLIGTSFMKTSNPGEALQKLIGSTL